MNNVERRQKIVAEALSWENTPYHHEGRMKGVGVDCAMFPAEVYEAAGEIPHIDVDHYPPDWMMHRSEERYLAMVQRYAYQITEEEALPGDMVTYRVGRCFAHGAIIIDWPTIIHSSNREKSVVQANGTTGWLEDRVREFWRLNTLRDA